MAAAKTLGIAPPLPPEEPIDGDAEPARCIRCSRNANPDPAKSMIRPEGEPAFGPLCGFCRRKFLHGFKRAAANKSRYRSEYGLLLSEFGQLYMMQRGLCAICHDRRAPGGKQHNQHLKTGALVVDHSHKTGEVRGLLCARCNSAIGLLNDDPALLASAVIYLTTQLPMRVLRAAPAEDAG